MRRLLLIFLAAALAATPALAATRHEHLFTSTFSTTKTATSSGIKFSTNRSAYQPPAVGQPADRVVKTVFTMAKGTKINPSAAPACTVAKLTATGPVACPSRSKIGTGSATVITGLPAFDPVNEKVQIFAAKGSLIAYLTGLQTTTIPLTVKGSKLTAVVPRTCLPPGTVAQNCPNGEAVLKILKVTIKPVKSGGKTLVTTPRTCTGGKWTNTALYTFANGDTEKETSTSRCHK